MMKLFLVSTCLLVQVALLYGQPLESDAEVKFLRALQNVLIRAENGKDQATASGSEVCDFKVCSYSVSWNKKGGNKPQVHKVTTQAEATANFIGNMLNKDDYHVRVCRSDLEEVTRECHEEKGKSMVG